MSLIQGFRISRRRRARSGFFAVAITIFVALGSTHAVASTPHKNKPLSLVDVTANLGPNATDQAFYVARAEGLFEKYGLNVNWLETTGGGMQDVETIASGATQFTITTASNSLIAAQQGAPLRGLFSTTVGTPEQLTIAKSYAAAHNIPAADQTQKQILAQFLALKGTHITVAVSGLTGPNVVLMDAVAHKYGLTVGGSCPSCDIDFVSVGTVPNSVTAFISGKDDSVANVPPYTTQPDSVLIQYGKLQPVSNALASFGDTTISMVQQHPDTVQAFVNAIADADTVFKRAHRVKAYSDMETVLENNGDSASQAVYAVKVENLYFKNPYPTRAQYDETLADYNLSTTTPYTMPYLTFFVLRFLATAEKLLGVPLP